MIVCGRWKRRKRRVRRTAGVAPSAAQTTGKNVETTKIFVFCFWFDDSHLARAQRGAQYLSKPSACVEEEATGHRLETHEYLINHPFQAICRCISPPSQTYIICRPQDDTCQTVTGIAVAAQSLRPDTWCRESPERLGRAAAVAAATAGGGRRDREGRTGGTSRRIGDDGLRRCGRPRPQMFKPTAVARLDDGVARVRPKGEVRGRRFFQDLLVQVLPTYPRVPVAGLGFESGSTRL